MGELDLYYEMVLKIDFILKDLIVAFCYCYFVKPYINNKKHLWLVGAAYTLTMAALRYMPYYISNFAAYLFGVAVGFVVMALLDLKSGKVRLLQKIFLSCAFFSVRWLALAVPVNGWEFMDSFLVKAIVKEGVMTKYDSFLIFVCESVLDLPIDFAFIFFAVWIIRRAYACGDEDLTAAEFVMLSIPMASMALSYNVKKFYERRYIEDSVNKDVFDLYAGHNFEFFIYYAFMFAAIPAIIMMHRQIKNAQERELANERNAEQMGNMKRHISEVEGIYGDIRAMKHDIGNHIMTLECLCERNEYDEAQSYLERLKHSFYSSFAEIKSGNPVTDVILTQGLKQAKENGIEFMCNFHYPDNIDVFDLSIILNNALENAIEAASGCASPYIKISSRRRANAYMIEIKNSFEGSISYNESTGLPDTIKADRRRHGYGLESIRRTAQKYFGDIDISTEGGEFTLCVMLMLK